MSTTPGDFQISDKVRRELYAMIREFWKRVRGEVRAPDRRYYPLGKAASYGGNHGYGAQSISAGGWGNVAINTTVGEHTDDVDPGFGACGYISFDNAGVYRIRGEISAKGSVGYVQPFSVRIVKDPGGTPIVISEEMPSHTEATGSGTDIEGYSGVDTIFTAAAGDSVGIQAFSPTNNLTVTHAALTVGLA